MPRAHFLSPLSSRLRAVVLAAVLLPVCVTASPRRAAKGQVVEAAKKKKKKKRKGAKPAPAPVAPSKPGAKAPAPVQARAPVQSPAAVETPAPAETPARVEVPAAVEEHRPGNDAPVPEIPPPSSELNPPLAEKAPVGPSPQSPQVARGETRLDLGVAAGLNTPSGVFGVELEFRPIQWLGFQVGGGTGEWGYRVSPLLRLYPLGRRSFSPFLEAGASFNLGQEATVSGDEEAQPVELLFTPVAVVSLGVRGDLGAHAFITPRVGWGKRLRQDNIRETHGSLIDPSGELVSSLEQPEGLLVGLSVGVSFL